MSEEKKAEEVASTSNGEKELATRQGLADLMSIEDAEALQKEADKRLALQKIFKETSLKITSATGWILWGTHYRITEAQAEKIRQFWGISILNPHLNRADYEDADGKYYIWTATAVIKKGEIEFTALGTCSSRDDFFAKVGGDWKPLKEIDQQNIMKKANANMLVNGLSRFLGLQDITKEELINAGIKMTDIQGIHFDSQQEVDQEKVVEIKRWMLELYKTNEKCREELYKLTTWTDKKGKEIKGKNELKKLSAKQINMIYKRIKGRWENAHPPVDKTQPPKKDPTPETPSEPKAKLPESASEKDKPQITIEELEELAELKRYDIVETAKTLTGKTWHIDKFSQEELQKIRDSLRGL